MAEEGSRVQVSKLYKDYRQYALDYEGKPHSIQVFSHAMEHAGYRKIKAHGRNFYEGLKFV